MTDSDIIKELEGCVRKAHEMLRRFYRIIKRQEAEIMAKEIEYNDMLEQCKSVEKHLEKAKAEAVKEFAENFKQDIKKHRLEMNMNGLKGTHRTEEITYETVIEYIDNLVKEMGGDADG